MNDIAPFQPIQPIPETSTPLSSYHHANPFSRPKIVQYIVVFIVLISGLVGSLIMLSTSKEIRSRASNNGPVLSINPGEKSLTVGQTAALGVLLNTHDETVSVVKLQLSYDPTAVQISGFTNGTILPVVLSKAVYANGKIDMTLAVQPTTPFKGSGIIGTIQMKLLSEKNSAITFTNMSEVAVLSKDTNALADTQGTSITGSNISINPTSTPEIIANTNAFPYGNPGDIPIVGNWTGDKRDLPAVIRGSDWYLKNAQTGGDADMVISISDIPSGHPRHFLSCDWTGSGVKTPAIITNGTWYIRNSNTSGKPDFSFSYGLTSDIPICGNWTGKSNGQQTPGIYRDGVWYLRNSNTAGEADIHYVFGNKGDIPVVGHWTGTKTDYPGVFRNTTFFQRNAHTDGVADRTISFGNLGDIPIIGDWDGKGKSLTGVVRENMWFLNNR